MSKIIRDSLSKVLQDLYVENTNGCYEELGRAVEDGGPNCECFLGAAQTVDETSAVWLQRAMEAFRLGPMIMTSN